MNNPARDPGPSAGPIRLGAVTVVRHDENDTAAPEPSPGATQLVLHLVERGTALLGAAGEAVQVPAASLVARVQAGAVTVIAHGSWTGYVAALPRDLVPVADRLLARAAGQVIPIGTGDGAVLRDLLRSVDEHRRELSALAADRLGRTVIDLVTAALGTQRLAASESDALRLQVLEFIRTHLADPDLTHDSIARAHNISGRTLHRLFDDDMNTPSQLIKTLRLNAVRDDLASLDTDEPVARIAARWGFQDTPNFNRAFRAAFGQTPSEARRSP